MVTVDAALPLWQPVQEPSPGAPVVRVGATLEDANSSGIATAMAPANAKPADTRPLFNRIVGYIIDIWLSFVSRRQEPVTHRSHTRYRPLLIGHELQAPFRPLHRPAAWRGGAGDCCSWKLRDSFENATAGRICLFPHAGITSLTDMPSRGRT